MLYGTGILRNRGKLLAVGVAALLFAAFLALSDVYAAAAAEDDSTIDFVLVIDNSGTMARSDPKGLTVSAAKMFIDMLPKKNARVAVVEFGSNYGDGAFSPEKYTDYVRVSFPLSDISSPDQKNACKQVISNTKQDGRYTPLGYAFQAACEVLEKGGATPGDAGILLISDFRVTGQKKEDFLEDGYNYQSLVDAEKTASENEWSVYTLEMNFDQKNDNPGDYTERIAARLRSQIPEKAGKGEYFPMKNAAQAQKRFAEIFIDFFDPNNQDESQVQSQITDEQGDASFPFTVGELVAELNVTLTCDDTSSVRSIEIGRGGDLTSYDLTGYSAPIEERERTITKEDRYITIKMMVPTPGDDWEVVVHGEAQTELGMYALSIHDMNLGLQAVTDTQEAGTGSVVTGTGRSVQFKAAYVYDGKPYISPKVYVTYPAVLTVEQTGEEIPMTTDSREYSALVSFDEPGTYTVRAVVSGDTFRTGSIETGEFNVIVEDLPPETEQTEEAEETEEPEETETELPPETEFPNHPVERLTEEQITIRIPAGKGVPVRLNWSDYFSDPDGTAPIISVMESNPGNTIVKEQDEEGMSLSAAKTGAASYLITAQDADDPSVESSILIKVTAEKEKGISLSDIPLSMLLTGVGILAVFILLIVLIIRKIRK